VKKGKSGICGLTSGFGPVFVGFAGLSSGLVW
jgi:hypothetical protein